MRHLSPDPYLSTAIESAGTRLPASWSSSVRRGGRAELCLAQAPFTAWCNAQPRRRSSTAGGGTAVDLCSAAGEGRPRPETDVPAGATRRHCQQYYGSRWQVDSCAQLPKNRSPAWGPPHPEQNQLIISANSYPHGLTLPEPDCISSQVTDQRPATARTKFFAEMRSSARAS